MSSTYKAISFCLAFWVLLSSIGISLDMHFCRGELKSVRLFGYADSCHTLKVKTQNKTNCAKSLKICNHKIHAISNTVKKRICCKNERIDFVTHDFLQKDFLFKITFLKEFYYRVFSSYFSCIEKTFQFIPIPFLNYKPPNLFKDISVFVQSFLL
ncbi:MAG: HYC_CC_PP family protein [Flavicella sp.]